MEELGDVFCLPARFLQHLAGVDGFGAAKLLRLLRKEIGEAAEIFAARGGQGLCPLALGEGAVRGLHGAVHIRLRRLRDLRPVIAGCRVHRGEGAAIRGIGPFAIDEHLVALQRGHGSASFDVVRQ